VILDNFSTLGEVEDENAASSFNDIQQFLLQLKVQGVATMLVHHANKTGEDFRGSSKLAATFETIIKLERLQETYEDGTAQFQVHWDKVRAGGPSRVLRGVVAKLAYQRDAAAEEPRPVWEYVAEDLPLLQEMKTLLEEGRFINQREIALHFGKSAPMARTWINKGAVAGMWTEEFIGRCFAFGKRKRDQGKTEPAHRHLNGLADRAPSGGGREPVLSKALDKLLFRLRLQRLNHEARPEIKHAKVSSLYAGT
jgi:hypothetical protein